MPMILSLSNPPPLVLTRPDFTFVDPPSAMPSTAYVNPAQMSQDQQVEPTMSKRRSCATGKRRRAPTPDDSGDSSSQPPRKNRDGPKKKKANRACAHCQKAHLTCDDCKYIGNLCVHPSHRRLIQHGLVSAVSSVEWQIVALKGIARKPSIFLTMTNLVCHQ